MTYDPAEYFRLTSDVPTEQEMDLASQLQEESEWEDESECQDNK